ncbi:cysteine desulfurase family protein [Sporichthya sp.]|uniref:cysteine desulfurase family protein n=1 Tax=Sporichthya sp. TaxID=65475 RepID=UPI00184AE596|nr:cysteine desulfurase family protein [Sporichthya sp.]MBA3743366.1 cysteine desulfurase [Sporichthya sp.]
MTYLDHAATTPMVPEALAAMTAELGRVGNPSSLHGSGRAARRVVEESRETIAAALGCRPGEVVFTGGGTDADNVALKGLYWARHREDPARRRILISAVEHHAVLDPAAWLAQQQGAVLEVLPVDSLGRLRPETLRAAIEADPASVALISVMWANNEVGTVQPIAELAAVAREFEIPLHSDAVQAIGALPVDFAASGVSAMSLTGHKLGGPLGIGALVLARGTVPVPLLHGGGQERDVHSGTLDTPSIAGFAAAVEAAVRNLDAHAATLHALRSELVAGVLAAVPDARYNGDPDDRLPGIAHFSFAGCEGDSLLMLLDARGIECSTGSACSAGVARPSHVLIAMGHDEASARSSLRFSLGHSSTESDVAQLLEALPPVVERARRAGEIAAARHNRS